MTPAPSTPVPAAVQALPCSGIEVTAEQFAILQHLQANNVTVVTAGAGAGKTYTTVAAVIELIASGQAHADEFVLITFTNQAADELRARLQAKLQQLSGAGGGLQRRSFWLEQRERLSAAYMGTIHGFCKQLLDLYGYGQGVAREASVSMSQTLIRSAMQAALEQLLQPGSRDPLAALVFDGDMAAYELRELLVEMLGKARNQGLDLEWVLRATERQPADAGKPVRLRCAELLVQVQAEYERNCRDAQQLDAAALLLEAAALLGGTHGAHVLQRVAERFRFLFIDEFQDTSLTQSRIASALARHLKTVVVGDRKQAIYAFAGASQRLLLDFAKQHGVRALPLSLSGRPTRQLLEVQTALFASMKGDFPELDEPLQPSDRNLDACGTLPHCVTLLASGRERDAEEVLRRAAERVARLTFTTVGRGSQRELAPVKPGDIAVLVRKNTEVAQWVQALNQAGIPARSDGGTPLLRRPEVVSMYRLLQLLACYPDDLALDEALPTPFFKDAAGLREKEADLLSHGSLRGDPLIDQLEHDHPDLARRLQDLRTASMEATVPELLGLIERTFDLKALYRAQHGDEEAALTLDRLRDYARSRFDNDQALTLRTFVQMLQRDIINGSELREPASKQSEQPPYVRVMTIHAAKGLEFPIVVIPNLHADRTGSQTLPYLIDAPHGLEVNVKSTACGNWTASRAYWDVLKERRRMVLSEEMRLFYVAVTRAQRMLLLIGSEGQPLRDGARSWQQEVEKAQPVMRAAGALFTRLMPT